MSAPIELAVALRRGDVPSAALALRRHVAGGGAIPPTVRKALSKADKSGKYEDDMKAVQLAREAFPAPEHVPHLPRTKASREAAENAAACGYDTREERAMDRNP